MANRGAGGGGNRLRGGRAIGGGQLLPAPRPHGHNGRGVQLRLDAIPWFGGNPNMAVTEERVLNTNVIFQTKGGFIERKNEELKKLYEDLQELQNVVNGATRRRETAKAKVGVRDYTAALDRIKLLRTEIKEKKGMALPMPKKLAKVPKV